MDEFAQQGHGSVPGPHPAAMLAALAASLIIPIAGMGSTLVLQTMFRVV